MSNKCYYSQAELSPRRLELVQLAFAQRDLRGNGIMKLNNLAAWYNPSQHPDVLCAKRSCAGVVRQFVDTFKEGNKDGMVLALFCQICLNLTFLKVSAEEFEAYYATVSTGIESDFAFEQLVRNTWGVTAELHAEEPNKFPLYLSSTFHGDLSQVPYDSPARAAFEESVTQVWVNSSMALV